MTIKKQTPKISELRAVEILNRAPLFKTLSPDDKRLIASMPGLFRAVHQNQRFIKAGDRDYSIYVLLSGRAMVSKNDMVLGYIEAGDFVGEVSFVTREPRTASVTAIEELIVLKIDADRFRRLPIKVREVVKDQIIAGLEERLNKLNKELVGYRRKDEAAKAAEEDKSDDVDVDGEQGHE